jgi:hypothetical protein
MTQGDEPLRDDHAELLRRRALTEDAARPDAVERTDGAGLPFFSSRLLPDRARRDICDLTAVSTQRWPGGS